MVARDGVEPPTPAFSAKLSVDSARHSFDFLSDFALLIGAKMEPSKVVQICLPRFASNRHGFHRVSRSSHFSTRAGRHFSSARNNSAADSVPPNRQITICARHDQEESSSPRLEEGDMKSVPIRRKSATHTDPVHQSKNEQIRPCSLTGWAWTASPSLLGADLKEGQQHAEHQCIRQG
jgi:hypothetical protein